MRRNGFAPGFTGQFRSHEQLRSVPDNKALLAAEHQTNKNEVTQMSVFAHPDFDRHEQVVFCHDQASGLKAIIAIHDTRLGPALGGCRMFPYANDEPSRVWN